ncbi:MAG TPA: PadR family transcriptional regulator [Actinophytocola sp.]|uniref:PadR family transcriptional regulator n=1 Tax=Actinophytocola sp. TaxID=1872138 RepID=UPI002DDD5B75|nr:PadR family transcriptional regulator [Actinophytocola sp.]HEV2780064.1 PadR family transcriptional regulator [Actinophytocola sp.]
MAKRRMSNPLALAVLSLLVEKPMHPYEMSSTLRERAKEASIKLNYGSLYSVVESLQRHGFIEVHETVREGRRPERTVYEITEAGRTELVDWLSELFAVPVKEYTQFEAALSLMPVLSPDSVVRLLQTRRTRLEAEIVGTQAVIDEMARQGLPYMFAIEADYVVELRRAELAFVERLITQISDGTFEGVDVWRRAHETGELPTAEDWQRALKRHPLRRVK